MNSQDRRNKLLKPANLLILSLVTIGFLIFIVFQVSALINKSYLLTRSDMFLIDSVKMLSRGFLSRGGKSSGSSIEFLDENHKTFWLTGIYYDAITDRKKLIDTLQYSEIILKVFTSREGYNSYLEKNNNDKIQVYGIKVGNTSFLSLENINKKKRGSRISILVFTSIVYCIFLSVHLGRVLLKDKGSQELDTP